MGRLLRMLGRLALITVFLATAMPGAGTTVWAGGQLAPGGTKSFRVTPGQTARLEFDGATLEIGATALAAETTISITSLAEQDLAQLDQGMANATPGAIKGYRFLPHSQRFKSKIKVSLPYDKTLIPLGLSEQDLRTYYFDDQSGRWQELELVSVDTRKMVVVSLTDHFTDMINATLTVPEHPQALSYNPNSIKDIKVANPGANVNLVETPRSTNMGDAGLLYPIEVPPGRNDLEPELGVRYNSSGGSSWLGLGWDLAVSAITIDTRWGVPRYDAAKETETYLLDGEQLSPVAHRGELQPRTAEKEFHTRVEREFQKIVRHGDDPASYWWEVTDKTGKRFFYGGDPQANAQDPSAVLADPASSGEANVFRWMLREVRDPNGNTIRYHYDVVNGGGPGEEPWRQIYLASVRYTGTNGGDGPYEVKFNRESGRPDVVVDGRPGFKTVLADRLASIDVRLVTTASPLIRRYRLVYETGQFSKSRLVSVTQYGEDGTTEFNRHTFEYFDEVADDPSQPTSLDGFDDAPGFGGASTVDGEGILFDQESTAFGGTAGSSDQTHLYAGFAPSGYRKENSFGAKVGLEVSGSTALLTLIDLNGDGLLDQVYRSGNDVYFRANTGGPQTAPSFAPNAIKIEGLSGLGSDDSTTFTIGAEVYATGGSVFANKSFTRNQSRVYLSDVDGDGLPDLVANGTVSFNSLVNGVPTFGPNSPTPLTAGASSDTSGMVQDPDAGRSDLEAEYHLVDPLRRWIAPYSGTVEITGQVRLLVAPPSTYTTADGVRASIQHNGSEIWAVTISNPNDTTARPIEGQNPGAGLATEVLAGDRLYFRVNSIDDGSYDAVEFNPTITYTQLDAPPSGGVDVDDVDENNMPLLVYNAGSDFAFGGRALPVTAPFAGTAVLTGLLDKPEVTSDDVTLEVTQGGVVVHQQTLPWDQTGTFTVSANLTLIKDELVQVRIAADSRLDLTSVRFVTGSSCQVPGKGPSPICLAYTTIDGQPAPMDANGQPLLAFTPPVTAQIYPRNGFDTPYLPFTVVLGEGGGAAGTCEDGTDNNGNGLVDLDDPTCHTTARVSWTVTADLFTDDYVVVPTDNTSVDYNMTLSVKGDSRRFAKQRVEVRNAAIVGSSTLDARFPVASGDALYFVIDAAATDESTLAFDESNLVQPELILANPLASEGADPALDCGDGIDNDGDGYVDVDDPQCQSLPPSVYSDVHLGLASTEAFGGGFRGWGFGQYNGEQTTTPVDETRLRLPQDEDDDAADYFVPMVPFLEEGHWRAEDEEAWIDGGRMSSSRLMVNYLDFPTGASFGGARGVVRYGGGNNLAAGGGAGYSVLSFGAGLTEGNNWSEIDFLDFNGDRYPDVVGGGEVQTTLPNGGLDDERIPVGGFGRVRESDSDSANVNLGATLSRQFGDARGRAKGITTEQAPYNLSASLGLTGSYGSYVARWDLVDINGDGLPDYVRQPNLLAGETELAVRLNLGYRFAAEETWANGSALREEQSLSGGLSTGVGATTPAYSFGGGFSHTLSTTAAEQDLVDVNGDGLVDLVLKDVDVITTTPGLLKSTTTGLSVRFNTGAGFTPAVYAYNGAMPRPIRENGTVSRNLGLHFTIPIPIPFTPSAIILNPGYNHGNNLGGFEVMLSDLDGDGYADHIYSDTNGNVEVNLNNHGRTNLLRKVNRPLGAVITLDYARSGNTTDMPGNRWVLSRVAEFDGQAGDGDVLLTDGSYLTQLTTYAYEGGKFDRAEREFLGFEKVVEEHRTPAPNPAQSALYRQTVRTYLNDTYYDKGLLRSEVTQDALGRRFGETINTYEIATVADSAARPGLEDFTATRFPRLVRTDRLFYEGEAAPGKSTYTTHAYDDLGNVTQFSDAGDVGAQDDVEATIEYSTCSATYIVGVPTKISVKGNGSEMRRREGTIDCVTGDLTQVREYLADGAAAITDLAYFGNGNLREVTGPPNQSGQRYKLTYEYDTVVQTHVSKVADSFGYSSTATHNYKLGTDETTTDTNANRTTYAYDAFGRLDSVTGPYEQGGPTPTIRFEYHPDAAVPWARTRHLDRFRSATDSIDTVTFVDGLMRVLQTKKDGTIHTAPDSAPQDVMIVSGRAVFDPFGRVAEEFHPVTEPLGTPGAFNPAFDGVSPTRTEYDVLDRVVEITLPDNTSTTSAYGFGPDRDGNSQFQTTITDANGKVKRTYVDVRSLVTSIRETNTLPDGTSQTIWTSYGYDPLKQLSRIEDDEHNVTLASYDNLGRKVSLDSPDGGKTESRYDLASNVVARTTANLRAEGKEIAYGYDFNRLVSVTYPSFPGNNVTYAYGGPGAPDNQAGRITTVVDQSGRTERSYGKLGEVVKETRTIATDTGGKPAPYTTEYVFDTFGRLQRLTYPDGEVLTYGYDSGGMIRSATGQKGSIGYDYARRLEYDKFEKRAFVETGNGVRTQYAYRPDNRRLANLSASQPDGTLFQNFGYDYDFVGNVVSLANEVPMPPPSEFGGPTSQTFRYDDLYRLVGAEGTYRFAPDKERQYSLSLSYDTIHNLLSKQQNDRIIQPSDVSIPQQKTSYEWVYEYGGPQPHAPTHLGDRTYRFDGNGNQTGWDHDQNGTRRTIVWDEENRIQSLFDNGHEKAYKYDAAGERVVKRGPQGETVYVNQYFTVRNGQIGTKHVVVGEVRLVSKLVKRGAEEKDRYFYHPDHLGSSSFVTDAAGKLYEHLEYFPSGETWVQEASNIQRTPYLFSAKELDEETGLQYFGARYLDPRVGLFLSTDPAFAEKPDEMGQKSLLLNLYSYALHNPVNSIDPTGREPYVLYRTEKEAAVHALADAAKLAAPHTKTLTEFGGTIFQDFESGEYYYIPPISSKYYEHGTMNPRQEPPNEGLFRDRLQKKVAYYHTHPTGENWSTGDKKFAEKEGPLYLLTPSGEVKVQRMVPKTFRDIVRGKRVTHTEPILREQKLGSLRENLAEYDRERPGKPKIPWVSRDPGPARPTE